MESKPRTQTTRTRATILPRPFAMACIVFGAVVPCAFGQTTYDWQPLTGGDASGSWNTAANWSPAGPANGTTGNDNTASFNAQDITVDSTATLDGAKSIGNLIFGDTDITTAAGWTVSPGTGGALTLANNTVASPGPIITVNALGTGKVAAISSVLNSTQGFHKQGAGTLALSGNNGSLTGRPVIDAGTLRIQHNNALGSLAGGSEGVFNYGTLEYDGNLAVQKGFYTGPNTISAINGNSTSSGFLDVYATGAQAMTFNVNSTASLLHSGQITIGAGTPGIIKTGAGTLTLSNTTVSNFNGNVDINQGTLAVSGSANFNPTTSSLGNLTTGKIVTVNTGAKLLLSGQDALGSATNNASYVLNADGGTIENGSTKFSTLGAITLKNGGTLNTQNGAGTGNVQAFNLRSSVTVSGTSGSFITTTGTTGNGVQLRSGANATTFNVGVTGDPTADLTVSAPLVIETLGAATSGDLKKTGSGKMVLTAANTYGGPTTVNGGTLLVNGSLASGPVTVSSNCTLGGTGVLGGSLTAVAGSTVAPGVGIGTLTVTGPAAVAGFFDVSIDATTSDRLTAASTLNITGATLQVSGVASQTAYVIASYNAGGLTGTFDPASVIPPGYVIDYNYNNLNRIALVSTGGGYGDFEAANGISGAGPTTDSDDDGIDNGIEFVIGGDPSGPDSNSTGLLPTLTLDDTYLNFTFRRTAASATFDPYVEYGSNLTNWTVAEAGQPPATPVLINVIPNGFGVGIDSVTVRIPRALAMPGNTLFARLGVEIP